MVKNLISDPILACLAQFRDPIFCEFYLHQMLNMIADYHLMQFQRKRTIQTQENVEKSLFRSDLGPLRSNLGRQIFFSKTWLCQSLGIMISIIT